MIPRVTATVDLGALRHNCALARRLAPGARLMAAIKADAYGHGAVPVARALAGHADALAVACLEEALVLREAGIQAPVVLLEGVLSAEEVQEALRHRLELVVHADWQLALLEALPAGTRLSLWIKLDSGMHRLGFPPADVPALRARLAARPDWALSGWMTHLARADEPQRPETAEQLRVFAQALQGVPGLRSIANSAGLLAWPEARAGWVRPGLMLYGASPFAGHTGADHGLRPVMTLESRLVSVREFPAGAAIGYGGAYRCPAATRIGVVAAGYADGVRRSLPTGTPLQVAGRRAPLVGRVSMDMITVDLGAVPEAQVGDAVRLWGPGLPVEEIAGCAGTIAYELFCGLTRRVRFVHAG